MVVNWLKDLCIYPDVSPDPWGSAEFVADLIDLIWCCFSPSQFGLQVQSKESSLGNEDFPWVLRLLSSLSEGSKRGVGSLSSAFEWIWDDMNLGCTRYHHERYNFYSKSKHEEKMFKFVSADCLQKVEKKKYWAVQKKKNPAVSAFFFTNSNI